MKAKLLELLGTGISQEAAANTVGCTPGYISQLMAEEEFRAAVINKRIAALTEQTARDKEYNSLEDALLVKLRKSLPLMVKPMEIVRAIQVVNNATRRGAGSEQVAPTAGASLVHLHLPKALAVQFTMNTNKEVVQVEGQVLVTLPSKSLHEMVSKEAALEAALEQQDLKLLPVQGEQLMRVQEHEHESIALSG